MITTDYTTLFEAFGVYEAMRPRWPFNTPTRRRMRPLPEGHELEPDELEAGISMIRLEFAAGEGAPLAEVHVYGDDITGAFVRVYGCDQRSVDRTYDRLLERMPKVLAQVQEAFRHDI